MIRPVTVDFESYAVETRPAYPPRPVGVSIKLWGEKPVYWAFGHATQNNCNETRARRELARVWKNKDGLLFHNGKFDVDVAEVHMGLKPPAWERFHDTMFLLFLDDPHQTEIGLKPAAERLLKMKPEERNAVAEWLIEHQPVHGVKISMSKDSDYYWAKYIPYAPGTVVAPYANGDTERTEALFKLLYKKTIQRNMEGAYNRERRIMPYLLDMERAGIPVNQRKLAADVALYKAWHDTIDLWLVKTLKCSPDINFNSGPQLAEAMLKAGMVDKASLGTTAKGRVKTDKESLIAAVKDEQLLSVLNYRARLNKCLSTYMLPWLKMAEASDGRIFTTWNQTKLEHGDGTMGTRTGRLSSTPNFQNIPKEFPTMFRHELNQNNKDRVKFPLCPFVGLPTLPLIRKYIVPRARGRVLLDRDYSQQELRVLAHFENGALLAAYNADPWLDVHEYARQMICQMTGKDFDRKVIKTVGFGLIYGMGVGLLAMRGGVTVEVAKEVKQAYLTLFPELRGMYQEMKMRMISRKPIRTWGGREVFCEPSKFIEGRRIDFDYKLVNYLVQGSGADCIKDAIIAYYERKPKDHHLILNVYDQLTVDCPRRQAVMGMRVLREAMEGVKFDVAMLSEGKWSDTNWAELHTFDKKGVSRGLKR